MRRAELKPSKADDRDWNLFTSSVLMLSVICRFSREEIDLFLQHGNYDFHQMRSLMKLRQSCLARERIADHYRALQACPSQELEGDQS